MEMVEEGVPCVKGGAAPAHTLLCPGKPTWVPGSPADTSGKPRPRKVPDSGWARPWQRREIKAHSAVPPESVLPRPLTLYQFSRSSEVKHMLVFKEQVRVGSKKHPTLLLGLTEEGKIGQKAFMFSNQNVSCTWRDRGEGIVWRYPGNWVEKFDLKGTGFGSEPGGSVRVEMKGLAGNTWAPHLWQRPKMMEWWGQQGEHDHWPLQALCNVESISVYFTWVDTQGSLRKRLWLFFLALWLWFSLLISSINKLKEVKWLVLSFS